MSNFRDFVETVCEPVEGYDCLPEERGMEEREGRRGESGKGDGEGRMGTGEGGV